MCYLSLVSDIFVSSFILKLRHHGVWATRAEVFEDNSLEQGRFGIYGWCEADDGHDYGNAVSFSSERTSLSTQSEVRSFAKVVEDRLNMLLNSDVGLPYMTTEAIREAGEILDQGMV